LLLLLEKLRGLAGDGGGVVDGEIAEGEPTNPHSSHGVIVVVGALASPKAACVLTLSEGRGWDAMVVESGADDEAGGSRSSAATTCVIAWAAASQSALA